MLRIAHASRLPCSGGGSGLRWVGHKVVVPLTCQTFGQHRTSSLKTAKRWNKVYGIRNEDGDR